MGDLKSLETTLVGVTGEYYVAAELSIRGYLASVTLRNSRGIDIIASNSDASRSVSIQVKTNKGGQPRWILNKKAETYFAKGHFYVFVVLHVVGQHPDFYVVPRETVSEYVSTTHREWLAGAGRQGKLRQDSSVRVFRDDEGQYKDAWDLLGL